MSEANQNRFGIVRHELVEIGRAVLRSEDIVEFFVRLFDNATRALRRFPILPAQLHHPIFVGLRRNRDRIVRMHPALRQIVRRQKLFHRRLGRNFHHVLRVRQERAVHRDGAGHSHALVFGDPVGE